MSKPIILISTQRSGTNLFRRAISQNDVFDDLSEPLDPNYGGGFWDIKSQLIKEKHELLIPTPENQDYIFRHFLEHFTEKSSKDYFIIDVKYDSTQHFNNVWHSPDIRPDLFGLIEKYNIPVIHLVRSNYLQVYISSLLADYTNTWADANVPDEDKPKNNFIEVDLQKLILAVTNREKRVNLFQSFVNLCPKKTTIFYEDLLSQNKQRLSNSVIQKIKKLLDLDKDFPTSVVTRKLSPPPSKLIKNYKEVAAVMKGLRYGRFLIE